MNYCKDCQYFQQGKRGMELFSPLFDEPDLCLHPDYANAITGGPSNPYQNRGFGRWYAKGCGADGLGWVAKLGGGA